jgi:hypothetical protein
MLWSACCEQQSCHRRTYQRYGVIEMIGLDYAEIADSALT